MKLAPLRTKESSQSVDETSTSLIQQMKQFMSSITEDTEATTAKSCLSSELNYIFTINEELENDREERISAFLNAEGIFQINLDHALRHYNKVD